jgi:hypothetical protein
MHMDQEFESRRLWSYAIVALAGLLIGMALGQLGAPSDPGRSRIEWPSPKPPQPRSLGP